MMRMPVGMKFLDGSIFARGKTIVGTKTRCRPKAYNWKPRLRLVWTGQSGWILLNFSRRSRAANGRNQFRPLL